MQVLDGILTLAQLYQVTGEDQLILYIRINNMGGITDIVCSSPTSSAKQNSSLGCQAIHEDYVGGLVMYTMARMG
jgi:hypothetical protein